MAKEMSSLFEQPYGESVRILGLDLGVTSIGWALIERTLVEEGDGSKDSGEIIAAGSHIYQPPFKLKESTELAKVYKNADRRKARGTRRRTERIRMRLDHLTKILRAHLMLPKAGPEWENLFSDHAIHPLALRTKGLDDELTLSELGRCLYHMCKRRGFLSNKGTKVLDLGVRRRPGRPVELIDLDPELKAAIAAMEQGKIKQAIEVESDDEEAASAKKKKKEETSDDDEGVVLSAISDLRANISEAKSRTLGEYLFNKMEEKAEDGKWSAMNRVRGTRTARDMYEFEFNLLWDTQAKFHPRELTPPLKAEIRNAIFFQRPLKIQRFLVGMCSLENKCKRARAGYPIAQEFRLWQDLNSLKIEGRRFDKKGNRQASQTGASLFPEKEITEFDLPVDRALTQDEKENLAKRLMVEKHLTWSAIKKELGLSSSQCTMNLERSKSNGLTGAETRSRIEQTVPGLWQKLLNGEIVIEVKGMEKKPTVDSLIEALFSITDSGSLLKHLRSHYNLSAEQAYQLATLELPPGVMGLSSAAMRKILPHMKKGLGYSEAFTAAGYLRRDETVLEGQPRIPWDALASTLLKAGKGGKMRPKVNNPAVSKCLFQTRRLVNKIVFEHGMPDIIRVEMAREIRNTKKDKEKIEKEKKNQEKVRKEASSQLESFGMNPENKVDILKYQLWKEAGEICPYTGESIGIRKLFSDATEIDHIIPWSTSLDNSFKNKVVCIAESNREKAKRTPFQAFGSNKQKFQEIIDRVESSKMSKYKKSRFLLGSPADPHPNDTQSMVLKHAAQRLLSDTSFITREAKEMLRLLGCDVETVKGSTTAIIRKSWGLNPLLQKPDAKTGEVSDDKNRDDHRHHAIDAVVIALTDVRFMQLLSRLSALYGGYALGEHDLKIAQPWPGFRDDMEEVLKNMVVTHEPNRKVSGSLTEETVYGLDLKRSERTARKNVGDLTAKMITQIRSDHLRGLIQARVEEAGDIKRAFPDGKFTYKLPNGKTVTVKSVKYVESVAGKFTVDENGTVTWPGYAPFCNREGKVIGWRATGGNHHLAIFERADGSRWAEAVSIFEATERRRRGERVYQDATNGDRLLFALHKGDMVIAEREGVERTFRVQSFSTVPNIYLCLRLPEDANSGSASVVTDGGVRIVSDGNLLKVKGLAQFS